MTPPPSSSSSFAAALRRSRLWPALAAAAATAGAALAPATSEEDGGAVSIWQVAGEQATIYLVGTVHLLREEDLPVPETYDEVYALADELVFELDMGELLSPAAAIRVQRLGRLPADQTLEDRIGGETMGRLREYLEGRSLPRDTLDRLHPGVVYLTLGTLEAMAQGARPEHGLEMIYHAKALADGKPTRGLESIEDQIGRLVAFDDALLASLIGEALDDAADSDSADTLDEIVGAWRSGDAEALAALVVDPMDQWPEVSQSLLVDRNEEWIPAIESAIAGDRNVAFLVGAAHLVGEGSVVEMLEARGHAVEQLRGDGSPGSAP